MIEHRMRCTNPDCGRSIRVPEQALGHRIRCPACKQEMRVPGTLEELRKLDAKKHYRLRITKGPAFAGTEHVLDPDRAYTVGRSDDCDVELPGPTVSRRHFSMHWVNSQWVLEDLNTTTGTQVDGLAVSKKGLQGDETIEVGAYVLQLLPPGAGLAAPTSHTAVVVPHGDPEPFRVSREPDESERAVREAEQRLRDAESYSDFKPEHLEATGLDSSRRYSLSLATRLLGVACLLAAVTVLSLFGKRWFFGPPASETAYAVPDPNAVAVEPLPAKFVNALSEQDFELATTLLKEGKAAGTYSGRRYERMKVRLQSAIRQYRKALLADARQAQGEQDWAQAEQLIEAAQCPELGPLPREWKPVQDACRQHAHIAAAESCLEAERYEDALVEAQAAKRIDPSNPCVEDLLDDISASRGAGLLIRVHPDTVDARVTLGERDFLVGREQWKLPVGRAPLRVSAPGFFEHEEPVDLKAGQLRVLNVVLTEQAPPELWALLALQRAEAMAPLRLAALHYAEVEALPTALTQPFLDYAENTGHREPSGAKLRVARITLNSGEEFVARIWSEVTTNLAVKVLPQGDTRVVKKEDLAALEDLDPEAAAEAVLERIAHEYQAGLPVLETLEQLAKLRADLESQPDVAARVCGSFVQNRLCRVEGSCAYCATRGTATCPACAGKGLHRQVVTCDFCKGTGEAKCLACKGAGTQRCKACNGVGTLRETATRWHHGKRQSYTREVTCSTCDGKGYVPCKKCGGSGKRTCPKCMGSRKVEKDVPCPMCNKGVIACPACGGAGTKEAMLPDKRRAAEVEAAERYRAARP